MGTLQENSFVIRGRGFTDLPSKLDWQLGPDVSNPQKVLSVTSCGGPDKGAMRSWMQ